MPDARSINRSMFWRIERRLLSANRGRVFVILLALGAGAAVTAALLNLQVDAKRRLTTEFRSFGANVVITAKDRNDGPKLLDQSLFEAVPGRSEGGEVSRAAYLYGIADISNPETPTKETKAVVVGYRAWYTHPERVLSAALFDYVQHSAVLSSDMRCAVGQRLAAKLSLKQASAIRIATGAGVEEDSVFLLPVTGGPEDDQVFVELDKAQRLLARPSQISLIQVSVPGTTKQIEQFLEKLRVDLPDAQGRPIRQFTEGESRIYNRISGVLNATVAVILILTALCVMAAMTNIAMERKNDVALMKAIGGAARRVLRLFLIEATLLGFAGGLLGAAVGLFLSIWLGKAVFGVAAQPRFVVYPVSVALTILVAILGAFPLRRLVEIRPAVIFRGGE